MSYFESIASFMGLSGILLPVAKTLIQYIESDKKKKIGTRYFFNTLWMDSEKDYIKKLYVKDMKIIDTLLETDLNKLSEDDISHYLNILDNNLSHFVSIGKHKDFTNKSIFKTLKPKNFMSFVFTFGLYKSLFETMDKSGKKSKKQKPTLGLTLVSALATKKARISVSAYLTICVTTILYLVVTKLLGVYSDPTVLWICFILGTGVFTSQQLLEYRIRKGFYGYNEYEAREIISFMLENQRNPDNHFKGKNPIVFPPVEETTHKSDVILVPGMGLSHE